MIGKKRKLIVPVVAIMMCAVALAGVAYAYTASLSVNNNETPDGDWIQIDLDGDPATAIAEIDDGLIVLNDNIAYKWNSEKQPSAGYDKYNTVKYGIEEGAFLSFDLKITGTVNTAKVTVKSTDLAATLATQVGALTLGDMISLKVGLAADGTGAVAFNPAGTDLSVTFTAPTETDFTVYLFIAQGGDDTGIIQAEKLASAAADYAAAYVALVNAAPAFTLSFTADSAAMA